MVFATFDPADSLLKTSFPHDSLGVCFVCMCICVWGGMLYRYIHMCKCTCVYIEAELMSSVFIDHPALYLLRQHLLLNLKLTNSSLSSQLSSPGSSVSVSRVLRVRWPSWPRGFYVGSNH